MIVLALVAAACAGSLTRTAAVDAPSPGPTEDTEVISDRCNDYEISQTSVRSFKVTGVVNVELHLSVSRLSLCAATYGEPASARV